MWALLEVTDVALIDDMVSALAAQDGATVFATIDRLVEVGNDPRRFAADLLQRFRDLVLLSVAPGADSPRLVDAPASTKSNGALLSRSPPPDGVRRGCRGGNDVPM